MVSDNTKSIIEQAKAIFDLHRQNLESEHPDRFVAIEPVSGDCFVEDSFDAAVRAARSGHPERLTHTIHIGHEAAFHIGLMER